MELNKQSAKNGTIIVCKDHLEWGNWTMWLGINGWEIKGRSGTRMLDEAEFKFWNVVK